MSLDGAPPRIANPESPIPNPDLAFQRKEWRFERGGWIVILALVLGALLGAFGRGLLSSAEEEDEAGALRVKYERITRHELETHLYVRVAPSLLDGERVRLWIDRRYVDAVDITRITPEPARVEIARDRVNYIFDVADASRPIDITFTLTSEEFLRQRGRIGVGNRAAVRFTQFVFP